MEHSDQSQGNEGSAAGPSAQSPRHRQTVDRFVQLWGQMASDWGINRTMAQIHALLYCSEESLNTDDIMERLQISRGNANMNLRSLVDWKLVSKVRLSESRKDYYVAEKDVWHITAQIIRERKQREIKPVRQQLQACRSMLHEADVSCEELSGTDATLCRRLDNLIRLMDVVEAFSQALLPFVEKRDISMIREFIERAHAMDMASNEQVDEDAS